MQTAQILGTQKEAAENVPAAATKPAAQTKPGVDKAPDTIQTNLEAGANPVKTPEEEGRSKPIVPRLPISQFKQAQAEQKGPAADIPAMKSRKQRKRGGEKNPFSETKADGKKRELRTPISCWNPRSDLLGNMADAEAKMRRVRGGRSGTEIYSGAVYSERADLGRRDPVFQKQPFREYDDVMPDKKEDKEDSLENSSGDEDDDLRCRATEAAARMGIDMGRLLWRNRRKLEDRGDECYWEHVFHKSAHRFYKVLMHNQDHILNLHKVRLAE